MEKYEHIEVVGEGSYGVVMKCRHRESGQIVAIKKFIETEEDQNIRKMALREIRMLRRLHHDNLVNLIEVFRRKRRFFLVFEYVDHTVLDELDAHPGGLGEQLTREHIFQVVRGIHFCHNNNIVHRDVKPENVLISSLGVVKLCDFGFARLLVPSGEQYTDYVATRWYRAPELLVGDTKYGRAVDIWAIGCLFSEMMSGDPLFPGDSDIDQLYKICQLQGKLCPRHQQIISKSPLLKSVDDNVVDVVNKHRALTKAFPTWNNLCVDFLFACLSLNPDERATTIQLLEHKFFTHDDFPLKFLPELQVKVQQEFSSNPLMKRLQQSAEHDKFRGVRRASHIEMPRWKICLAEPRPSEPVSPLLPLNVRNIQNENDKLSVPHKLNENLTPMDINDEMETNNNNIKFSTLNKYSPLLSGTGGGGDAYGMRGNLIPSCLGKPSKNSAETPTSPAPFLSLGSNDFHNLPPPTINVTQHLNGTLKSINYTGHRNEVKLGIPRIGRNGAALMPKTQLIRRLDRELLLDPDIQNSHNKQPALRTYKNTYDDFSLPNLPGATNSPVKGPKKKLNPVNTNSNQVDSFISPRLFGSQSRSPSISPPGRLSPNLPMV